MPDAGVGLAPVVVGGMYGTDAALLIDTTVSPAAVAVAGIAVTKVAESGWGGRSSDASFCCFTRFEIVV